MTRRKIAVDWKMLLGFGGLLFLISSIGFIGIQQIHDLAESISRLARQEIPVQNAVLEMKSSNSKYAMAIRSYMFWKSARYLDAAAASEKLGLINSAAEGFDKNLNIYTSRLPTPAQKEWAEIIRSSEGRLRQISEDIIDRVNKTDAASSDAQKSQLESINRLLMDFESELFRIDAFLDVPIQKFNLASIDRRLAIAEAGRRRSIVLLTWSLLIALCLGVQTAFLIYQRSKREKENRELLWRKVVGVEEEERNNLSLEIHDQMGQDLSALKIFLGLIEKDLAAESAETREKIEKAKRILDVLMTKAHNISEMLRPPELDDLGLIESIGALILHYQEMTGSNYHYSKPDYEIKLPLEHSLVLYRVAQEALTNIAKHSGAKTIEVRIEQKGESVYFMVRDDGGGFDYNDYLKQPRRRKEDRVRLGLQGLRERVEVFGGTLKVCAKPGKGTTLEVTLPLA